MKTKFSIIMAIVVLIIYTTIGSGISSFTFKKAGAEETTAPRILMDEKFSHPQPYGDPCKMILSGWDVDDSGGELSYGYFQWFKIRDNSATNKVSMQKQFIKQTYGKVTLEYRFKPVVLQDVDFKLMDGDTYGIKIGITTSGDMYYTNSSGENVTMQSYNGNADYGVKIVADITNKTADIYVNGVHRGEGISFSNNVNELNTLYIGTSDSSTGDLYLGGFKIYTGFLVYEQFLSYIHDNEPSEWIINDAGGKVNIQENKSAPYPDIYSLKMEDTSTDNNSSLKKSFTPQTGKTVFETSFLLPASKDGYRFELRNDDTSGPVIETKEGNLCYRDLSGNLKVIQPYKENIWYKIKMVSDIETNSSQIYINGKLAIEDAPFSNSIESINTVYYETPVSETGVMWLDDIMLYPFQPEPTDYVPAPNPVSNPDTYIGVQSCPLWRAGSHGGWDFITPYADRKPLLGWYEDGNPEVADWEIKWLAENGVDFVFYTWYLPPGRSNVPLRTSALDNSLHDGFFNAKYKEHMKFAITWENNPGHPSMGFADFRNHIVPYWMEYYFNDPQYMVIDNKPVIGILGLEGLIRDFGGVDAVKKEIDYLRQQLVDMGFSGAHVLTWYHGTSRAEMDKRYKAGFDYIYAYTFWSDNIMTMQNMLNRQRDNGSPLGVVPTLSMGWDHMPWGGSPLGWVTEADFLELAGWFKDTYMPSLPENSLGRKLLLLDNWNEYGEGHFMLPTEGLGFRYLDGIRKTWIGSTIENVIPTSSQKARLNYLFPVEREQHNPTNLALNKKATMEDGTPFYGHDALKAIDGDRGTYAQANTNTPWNLTIDLESQTYIDKVVFIPDPINYAEDYTIDVSSDGDKWDIVAVQINGKGAVKTYKFPEVKVKYVRLNVYKAHTGGEWGHAVRELEVYISSSPSVSSSDQITPDISTETQSQQSSQEESTGKTKPPYTLIIVGVLIMIGIAVAVVIFRGYRKK